MKKIKKIAKKLMSRMKIVQFVNQNMNYVKLIFIRKWKML